MNVAYLVVTFSSPYLNQTLASLPKGARVHVFNNRAADWSLSKAWNVGIYDLCVEGYDSVVVCGDDIVLGDGSGDKMAQALASNDELLVVSARHLPPGTPVPDDLAVGACDFSCFVTNLRLFEEVGGFDELLYPAYFEDNDMHWRIRQRGYEAASAGFAPYFHYLNGTIKSDPIRRALVEQRFPILKQYYIHRWGGEPGHEVYTEPFDGHPGYRP